MQQVQQVLRVLVPQELPDNPAHRVLTAHLEVRDPEGLLALQGQQGSLVCRVLLDCLVHQATEARVW